jgi:ABC-type proline/glycine betaine transport system ATPase subunit
MRAGRLAQVGTPAEIWERPADEFVAEFVRSRHG